MKKTIASALMFLCVAAMAAETNDPNYFEGYPTLTEVRQAVVSQTTWEAYLQYNKSVSTETRGQYWAELRSWLQNYMATTNVFPDRILNNPELISFLKPLHICDQIDNDLSLMGAKYFNAYWYADYPKIMENWFNSQTNYVAENFVYVQLVRAQTKTGFGRPLPFTLLVNYYAISLANGSLDERVFFFGKDFDRIRNQLGEMATTEIKHKLRIDKQNGIGNGFLVGPDGVNPVEGPAKAFIASLQAPKCAGLKEWLAVYFPDYKWVEPEWKSDEEIEALKNAIYWGDKPFGMKNKMILSGYLGLDGFNEFVQKYNN